jgi:hypothetical protein
MPYDKESGKKFDSPTDALAEALPKGADASEVMDKLKEMGYSLEPAMGAVGLAVEIESAPEKADEEAKEESKEESKETSEEGIEAEPKEGDAPAEVAEISMGMMEAPEPMSKKRDRVAEGLMDKFKKGMV